MKKYLLHIKNNIIMQVIMDGLATASLALLPYLQKLLFDSISGKNSYHLLSIITIYSLLILLSLSFTYFDQINIWKGTIKFEKILKKDFFNAITNYSYKRFYSKDVGDYISIQGNEITQLDMDYVTPLIDIFKSINMIIIYGIVLFVLIDWRIGLLIVGASILVTFVPRITADKLSKKRKRYLDTKGKYISKMKDLLEGFKLINGKTKNSINKEHEEILNKTADKRYSYGKFKVVSLLLNGSFIHLLNVLSLGLAGYLMIKGEITIGTAVASLGYMNSFIEPIERLTYNINSISSVKDIKEKVKMYLTYDQSNVIQKKEFNNSIEFKNVTIHHKNFSLKDFNYEFKKGKKYAIIGHSGSGKSTIVNALMKYIEPNDGEIFIDGEYNQKIDTSEIISSVNQHEHIYMTNYKNNITVYNSFPIKNINKIKNSISEKMFNAIAEKENCQKLSGGEKNILSLMRMISEDKEICVMDEVLSSTDMNTTEQLYNMIINLENKTLIMVTHKLNQRLSEFDEIILMKDGEMAKSGTYEEIIEDEYYKFLSNIM